jgi:hypothetical protein
MPSDFIDQEDARRIKEAIEHPERLPRGLVPPPKEIAEQVARDKARLQPYYTDEAERRQLEFLTLLYYYQGTTIAYRSTSQGPEVLAVGYEEIGRVLRGKSQEERLKIIIKQP